MYYIKFFIFILILIYPLSCAKKKEDFGGGEEASSSSNPTGTSTNYSTNLTGTIIKQSDGNALSGVEVMYNESGLTSSVKSDDNGSYSISGLSYGSYTLTYSIDGYKGATQSASLSINNKNITVSTLPMLANNCSGGNISGIIKDSITKNAVSGVSISIRSGFNVRSGNKISGKTDTTASDGTYTLSNVDAGLYTVEATKSGFVTSYFNVNSCSGSLRQDTYMSETLSDGTMRIVLIWRGNQDFDSHLEIPVSANAHLYWGINQTDEITYNGVPTKDYLIYTDIGPGDNVTLDRESVDGIVENCTSGKCGPETITISKIRSGTYRYHVHNFDERDQVNSSHIADNRTYLQVFYNNLSYNFDVPKKTGNLWTVFDFDNSSGFTQLNTMSNEIEAADVDNH